jgi:diguanylate cyclase (GGDEF)-like protein
MTILVVDDAADTRTMMVRLLERGGYQNVVGIASAEEAYGYLGIDGGQPDPRGADLVLMDIMLPGVSGIDACRRIKAAEHLQDVPVLMVTAREEREELENALEAGASDYLCKPVERVALLGRVRHALRLKEEIDRRKQREVELVEMQRLLEEANRTLDQLASTDALTTIPNRRGFESCLWYEWARARRSRTSLALLLVDIDQFKAYNDTYGHPAGDECLRKVAVAIKGALRRSSDMVARYGGEEMVVVLPSTGAKAAHMLAERLRQVVEELDITHAASTVSKRLTVSIGCAAEVPEQDSAPEQLLEEADRALYAAKDAGRNCVRSFRELQ